ncbi:MAG TPA: DUF1232 domain-containing protein [Anaerolineales bacterium]|jgi:uncharacterized membrane protein YkvA (DUF1232 family)|nr:DUF1232 domain-containing protein [Anaerolineales bacterium]
MTTKKIEEELVEQGAKKVTDEDVEKVVDKSEEIKKKFSGRSLGRFVEDGQLLISLVKDYWAGTYRQVPYGTVAAIVFTLIYVFNPLDLVPDVLPIVGQIDDAAVVAGCLILVEQDLHAYRQWKSDQNKKT